MKPALGHRSLGYEVLLHLRVGDGTTRRDLRVAGRERSRQRLQRAAERCCVEIYTDTVIEEFFADRPFGPMRLDLLREQPDIQQRTSATEEQWTAARPQAQLVEADRAIALQVTTRPVSSLMNSLLKPAFNVRCQDRVRPPSTPLAPQVRPCWRAFGVVSGEGSR